MFILTYSTLWSLSFFFILTYLTFCFLFLTYLTPIFLTSSNSRATVALKHNFYIISGLEVSRTFLTPLIVIVIVLGSWSSPAFSLWFGHLVFSSSQIKLIYFVCFTFYLVFLVLLSTTYLSSSEIYDFYITQFSFLYWILILFMVNTVFTLMFVIEVLSTLIFLLLTTSVFSTSFFYKNINFDILNFFSHSTPLTFLRSILYFFWVSLVSSLNLFVFLIYLYKFVMTFDWFLLEYVFFYFISVSNSTSVLRFGISWFFIVFSLFLKCGIAPLYLWKPTFFKGLSTLTLLFYISFFYFYLFLFEFIKDFEFDRLD